MDFIDKYTNDKEATTTAQVQLRYIRSARGDDILLQTGEAPTMVTRTMKTTRDLFDTHQPLIDAVNVHNQWQKHQVENAHRQAQDERHQLFTDKVDTHRQAQDERHQLLADKVDTMNTQIQGLQHELAINATVAQSKEASQDMRHRSMLAIVSKQSEKHKLHEAGIQKLQPMIDDLCNVQQELAALTTGAVTTTNRQQHNEHLLRGIGRKLTTFEHCTAKATTELQDTLLANTAVHDAKRTGDRHLAATAIVELEERTANATSELQGFIHKVESQTNTIAATHVQQPAALYHIHDEFNTFRGNTAKATMQLQQSFDEFKDITAHTMKATVGHCNKTIAEHVTDPTKQAKPQKKKTTKTIKNNVVSMEAATEVQNALSHMQSASGMSKDVITCAAMSYTPKEHPMRGLLDQALCRLDAVDKTLFTGNKSTLHDKELEYREKQRLLEECVNRCATRPTYCSSAAASGCLKHTIRYMDAIDHERDSDELRALDQVQRMKTMNGIEEMNHDI